MTANSSIPPSPRPSPSIGLDPVLDFMRLLWNIEHGLQRSSKRMEAALGVTGPQRLVLRIVGRHPDLTAGELARLLHLHPSTITGILHRLVRKGLLRRERDRHDTRRVRLRIRPAARAFINVSTGTMESVITRALARIPSARVRHAQDVLSAVADALEADAEGPHRRRRSRSVT